MEVSFDLIDSATAYIAGLTPALSTAVRTSVGNIEANSKAAIQTGQKTGRIYKHRRKGKRGGYIVHQASAEGEAPANFNSDLANSIHGKMDAPGALSGEVRVGKSYGAILEPKRPFLAPAVEKEKPSFDAAIARVLEGR